MNLSGGSGARSQKLQDSSEMMGLMRALDTRGTSRNLTPSHARTLKTSDSSGRHITDILKRNPEKDIDKYTQGSAALVIPPLIPL